MDDPIFRWHEPEPEEPFRFACTILTLDHMPLLQSMALAQLAMDILLETADRADVILWGYIILPESVQFVVEVEHERDYHLWVDHFKTTSEKQLCEAILAQHELLIDQITHFNPAWGEAIYKCWQDGYHTQALSSPYAVSNRVADILRKPVDIGLVNHLEEWPFSSYRPQLD